MPNPSTVAEAEQSDGLLHETGFEDYTNSALADALAAFATMPPIVYEVIARLKKLDERDVTKLNPDKWRAPKPHWGEQSNLYLERVVLSLEDHING